MRSTMHGCGMQPFRPIKSTKPHMPVLVGGKALEPINGSFAGTVAKLPWSHDTTTPVVLPSRKPFPPKRSVPASTAPPCLAEMIVASAGVFR